MRPAEVIEHVAHSFGYEVTDIMARDQRQPRPWIRAVCYYVLHRGGLGSSDIGRLFDRDHGTVTHGIMAVVDRKLYEPQMRGLTHVSTWLDDLVAECLPLELKAAGVRNKR